MGRGGRGGRGHHFGGSHHHHHYGRGGGGGGGLGFEAAMDILHSRSIPPSLFNGVYTFVGSEMSFRTQIDQPMNNLLEQGLQQQQQMNMLMMGNLSMQQLNPSMQMQPMDPMMLQMQTPVMPNNTPIQSNNTPIQQININLIGNKTKPSNNCCLISTLLAGSFCIIPLFFMCCGWWKKIVFPAYELSVQAYRDICTLVQRNPTANNLTLTVADSAFNAEKARILYQTLSRGQITAFTFVNQSLECNGQFNEADDFKNNMLPIKSLTNVTSSITWGDMIV